MIFCLYYSLWVRGKNSSSVHCCITITPLIIGALINVPLYTMDSEDKCRRFFPLYRSISLRNIKPLLFCEIRTGGSKHFLLWFIHSDSTSFRRIINFHGSQILNNLTLIARQDILLPNGAAGE